MSRSRTAAEALPTAASSKPGEYVVVARRYRPQSFDELIGQEHVGRALSGAINTNRVGHAYLFTGARGVGKTSAARILAKALDCEHGPTPTPCNECDICQSISSGEDVDVLEIDGASNRGIEEMRELRQNVNIRPSRARFKIYIIDEVHMLTREAFNALLKTLEEPPEHVKFIFCTTEPEKIPITILSRCQRFDFAGIQAPSIAQRLQQIAAAEGVEAEPEALDILARRAAGSMRDSQSLLEQLLSMGGEAVTVQDVHRMLGTAGGERLETLVDAVVRRDPAAALAELDAALTQGVDVGQLLDQLIGYFRDLMAAAVGCPPEHFLFASGGQQAAIREAAGQLGLETILAMLQILDQTMSRLRYSTYRRTLAELALVRICKLEILDELPALIEQLESGAPLSASNSPSRPPARTTETAEKKKKKPEPLTNGNPGPVRGEAIHEEAASAEGGFTGGVTASASSLADTNRNFPMGGSGQSKDIAPAAVAAIELTADIAFSLWQQAVANQSEMVAEFAGHAAQVSVDSPSRLAVSFPRNYNVSKAFCERPAQTALFEKALEALIGRPVRVEFRLLADEPSTAAQPAAPAPRKGSQQQSHLAEKSQHPLVRRAVELFDARPVRVEQPQSSS